MKRTFYNASALLLAAESASSTYGMSNLTNVDLMDNIEFTLIIMFKHLNGQCRSKVQSQQGVFRLYVDSDLLLTL